MTILREGIFISIEGLDGAGKSTQIKLMEDFFRSRNREVFLTREPGGTKIGEKIRQIILDKANHEMAATTEALLYAASRGQHVKEIILPALKEGKVVVSDRFVDSSIAYQGGGRCLGEESIKMINDFATNGLEPDLTIFFNIDPTISLKRIKEDEIDRLEDEKIDFHKTVYRTYLNLARANPKRIKIVKADEDVATISQEIEKILLGFAQEKGL